jgi:hypothetical protein
MPQDGIHHHRRPGATVDGAMGNAGGNANPGAFVITQGDAAQAALLQDDQIKTATEHQQLIRLKAMAEELTALGRTHFGDQRFITGLRL